MNEFNLHLSSIWVTNSVFCLFFGGVQDAVQSLGGLTKVSNIFSLQVSFRQDVFFFSGLGCMLFTLVAFLVPTGKIDNVLKLFIGVLLSPKYLF